MPPTGLGRGRLFAGRFEILEKLGGGGMGMVYRVLDTKIREEIALKLFRPGIVADPMAVERFKNELKLARRIIHKNVCRMYDLNEEAGLPYITMEYVPGEDLRSLLRRAGRLSVEKILSVARQVCDGLAEAHHLDVVHRDLKPGNIMIDKEGNVHIMDFGIARPQSGSELTEAGTMIGTPEYMSPEQAEGLPADRRSDIYSLGVVLYEMVSGRVPFSGGTSLSVALKHKTDAPAPLGELNTQSPPKLNLLIMKCLEKQPERRPQSAAEVLSDLAEIEADVLGLGIPPPGKRAYPSAVQEAAEIPELRQSIAVLPFKDMSPQHDQDYFCEGLAEEIINALAQVKGLRVAARTSSFSFKGKEADIRDIGRLLNVASVLEGSVQKAGSRLRVTVQLINIADGFHLWSERFDRDVKDIFAVQDEISMAVVDKLKVDLREGEKEKITKRHTQSRAAHGLYLKGRYYYNRRFRGDMIKAVAFYERAINKDHGYALPYVGIGDVFHLLGLWSHMPPEICHENTKAALAKALEIDDTIGELYTSLAAFAQYCEWDTAKAEKYYLRSIELSPDYTEAHGWYAIMLGALGRAEEALREADRAMASNPLFSLAHAFKGIALLGLGRIEQAREQLARAVAMDPRQPMIYLFLGMAYLMKEAVPQKAIEPLKKAAEMGIPFGLGFLGLAYAVAGQKNEALKVLDRVEAMEKERYMPFLRRMAVRILPSLRRFRRLDRRYVAPLLKGFVYFGLNEPEKALDWFEESVRRRDYFLGYLRTPALFPDTPWSQSFRSHPRFVALLEKMNFRRTG
ncbi:MAG: protein kinase [Candidatus Aminicenantes bacterium]|nr:protein kinase [Candidatus Aminicenantes bacterium]